MESNLIRINDLMTIYSNITIFSYNNHHFASHSHKSIFSCNNTKHKTQTQRDRSAIKFSVLFMFESGVHSFRLCKCLSDVGVCLWQLHFFICRVKSISFLHRSNRMLCLFPLFTLPLCSPFSLVRMRIELFGHHIENASALFMWLFQVYLYEIYYLV